MKLITPTREAFELICAWAETGCKPWLSCHDEMVKLKQQDFSSEKAIHLKGPGDAFRAFHLERIIDGKLHLDWPWGSNRLQPVNKMNNENFLINLFLNLVSGIPNVAYFRGGERPGIPWNFPVPIFSHAPELGYVDLAWPWAESVIDASKWLQASSTEAKTRVNLVAKDRKLTAIWKRERSEIEYNDTLQLANWQTRKTKAAYYGVYKDIRHVLFEVALQNPDLIDTNIRPSSNVPLLALNPVSREAPVTTDMYDNATLREIGQAKERPPGYAWPLTRLFDGQPDYSPRDYKYLIVLLGSKGLSTSGRLANFLAHSGAVILLQKSAFSYDFSARMIPWVHYVPLSYSAADVAVKIKWLQANDKMALQIARNARNFGRSYLRLEDHLCYVASAFEALAEMQNGTDVLKPWSPVKVIEKATDE